LLGLFTARCSQPPPPNTPLFEKLRSFVPSQKGREEGGNARVMAEKELKLLML
jgi:hypothetical protein